MTPEEAIEFFKGELEGGKCSEHCIQCNANELALQALEKQIPKKPIKSDRQEIRYTLTYDCPTCGKQFTGTGFADYCYHCGQNLDWGDDY